MKIEVKKLIALRKLTGNTEFEYIPPTDICLVPLCTIKNAVKVYAKYEIYDDDSVEIQLTVNYVIEGQCSYCLEQAEKKIEFVSEILFLPEKDEENYYYDGINIDLTSAVNDAILISQPGVLLCKEDCKGIDIT